MKFLYPMPRSTYPNIIFTIFPISVSVQLSLRILQFVLKRTSFSQTKVWVTDKELCYCSGCLRQKSTQLANEDKPIVCALIQVFLNHKLGFEIHFTFHIRYTSLIHISFAKKLFKSIWSAFFVVVAKTVCHSCASHLVNARRPECVVNIESYAKVNRNKTQRSRPYFWILPLAGKRWLAKTRKKEVQQKKSSGVIGRNVTWNVCCE